MSNVSGLLFLGAVLAGLWLLSRGRPADDIGVLNGEGSASDMPGIGGVSLVRFGIDGRNSERVREVTREFLRDARRDEAFSTAVLGLLEANGVDPADRKAASLFLQSFVNDTIPTVADPAGFETIMAPAELLSQWMRGDPEGEDCDGKSILLSAMLDVVDVPNHVCLFDLNSDGMADHAAVILDYGEGSVYAETVVPGAPLGWQPPGVTPGDCVIVS